VNTALPTLPSAPLQRFNLLPSLDLHPSRAALWLPGQAAAAHGWCAPAVARQWHRHWSALLLARLQDDAQPVHELTHAATPLALAGPALLQATARHAGLLLLGKNLRLRIARSEVAAAQQALGRAAWDWVCREGAALHPGLADPRPWLDQGLAAGADLLGAGLLAQSWHDAPAALRRRADWKLPLDAEAPAAREASGMTPPQACRLCLQTLHFLEPEWLSSFPSIH
jgi:type III secretion protein K